MKRNQAREIAVQLGFSAAATGEDPQKIVETFLEKEHYASLSAEDELYAESASAKNRAFILDSVRGVAENRAMLDELIAQYASGWRTERISRSAAAVLRQAMYEILFMDDIPPKVSMNEAVNIARRYEDETLVSFVNGVLGGFYRDRFAAGENTSAEPAPGGIPAAGNPQADA